MENKIYKMAKAILDKQGYQTEIIEIYGTGSQLFRDDPSDLDFVVICEHYPLLRQKFFAKENGKLYDFMFYDKDAMIDQLKFGDFQFLAEELKLFNYFVLFRNTVYGRWDFEWDIFERKEAYMEFMRKRYMDSVGKRVKREKHTKGWVHYYIVLKIFENNKIEITEDMLKDIRALYYSEDHHPIIEWIETCLFE